MQRHLMLPFILIMGACGPTESKPRGNTKAANGSENSDQSVNDPAKMEASVLEKSTSNQEISNAYQSCSDGSTYSEVKIYNIYRNPIGGYSEFNPFHRSAAVSTVFRCSGRTTSDVNVLTSWKSGIVGDNNTYRISGPGGSNARPIGCGYYGTAWETTRKDYGHLIRGYDSATQTHWIYKQGGNNSDVPKNLQFQVVLAKFPNSPNGFDLGIAQRVYILADIYGKRMVAGEQDYNSRLRGMGFRIIDTLGYMGSDYHCTH